MTKPLIIYHADCTDGFGAAFAAWLKLGDEAEYVPMQYGKIDFDFEGGFFNLGKHEADNPCTFVAGRDIYILDFSLPKEAMDWLFANAKRVVWLDHHKTAFEMWCTHRPDAVEQGYYCKGWGDEDPEANFVLLDNNKSGALLAWEYFHPGTEVPMLIQHIDDRDRWQWNLPGSAEIHVALSSNQPWSFEQWKSFISHDKKCDDMFDSGNVILRAQKQHVERMAKQARKCCIGFIDNSEGFPCCAAAPGLAVNASLHQSEVGHELANASGTFGLVWYVASDLRVRCSLRSNGDYDVSAIARAFGGGGHRNAAGFETDIETLMNWLT